MNDLRPRPDPAPVRGWSDEALATAWFRALLNGLRSGDQRMVVLAQTELRRLGVEVAPCPQGDPP